MHGGLRERQKFSRKKKILKVAERLFRRRGFAETSMEEVSQTAGLAVGTLYNYFPSKSDIVLEIFRRGTGKALERGKGVVREHASDPAEALTQLVLVYMEVFAEHDRALWREAVRALLAAPGENRPYLDLDLHVIAQFAELLRSLQAEGRIGSEVDAGRGAITSYTLLVSWYAVFSEGESLSEAVIAREIRSTFQLFAQGLLPRPR